MRIRFCTISLLLLATFAQAPGILARPNAAPDPQTAGQPVPPVRAVSGTVLDPSGAPIPAAEVTLAAIDSRPAAQNQGQAETKTQTDNAGGFRFERVAPGNYRLDVHMEGFRDTRANVAVGARPIDGIRVVMPLAPQNQSLTVEAGDSSLQVVPEASENQNANTLDRSALDRVPVFDQDYVTTLSRFLDSNATSTGGVTLVVNGQEATGAGVSASAVQEVKINQNPYSALFSRPGRGRVEITTKGGTPQFHGSLNFMFRDSVFDARNAYALVKPPEQRRYYEGSLTGPVGHFKHTTFLLSLDRDEEDQQAIVVAQNLAGPVNESSPTPNRHDFASGRIFHDFASGDQLWIGFSYEWQSILGQNVGGNVLPEAATNYHHQEDDLYFNDRHVFSPRFISQTRFILSRELEPTTSATTAPSIVVAGAFTGGGAQVNLLRTEVHTQGNQTFTYTRGSHVLNFGFDVGDISRRGFDNLSNNLGTYDFSSLAAYSAGQFSTYTVQQGQPHLAFVQVELGGFVEDNIRVRPNFSVSLGLRYYFQNYFHDDPNNFAPRFGFAWAPTSKSKTVFRGGAGIFYDRTGAGPMSDVLYFDGSRLLRLILDNSSNTFPYPVPPSALVGVPTSVVTLDPRQRIPYIAQFSVGVERQITAKSSFTATYIGTQGFDMFRSIDANAPVAPFSTSPPPRPNPDLGQDREIQSAGYLQGNALELLFRGRPSKYFSGQVQYTLSKAYNNTSGINSFPEYSYDPSAEWGRADTDRRHKFDLLGSTQVGKLFDLGTALSLYSGYPVNETTGGDNYFDGQNNARPAGVPRNSLAGPGLIDLDLSLSHDFELGKSKKEARTLTVSLNSFNVLNHRNDLTYVGVITSPFFDRGVAANPPRRMQLNLQFKF